MSQIWSITPTTYGSARSEESIFQTWSTTPPIWVDSGAIAPPCSFSSVRKFPFDQLSLAAMSALSKYLPVRRKFSSNGDSEWMTPGAQGSSITRTMGNPSWDCIANLCPGLIASKTKKDGKTFGHCDQQELRGNSTCQLSCSMFRSKRRSNRKVSPL